MAEPKMVRVQTGPSSYIDFNEADAKEWRKTNKEYAAADAPVEDVADAAAEAKSVDAPVENKVMTAPVEKKAR